MLQFNFKAQPWLGVLEWLAEISKMSLDWNEVPPGIWICSLSGAIPFRKPVT